MQSLPYELLQHIASYLVPRGQCRLALASQHHYWYLYTDLLKWHAHKQYILIPNHKILGSVSVSHINNKVIIFRNFKLAGSKKLYAYNLTLLKFSGMHHYIDKIYISFNNLRISWLYSLYNILYRLLNLINYRYLHKNAFIVLVNMKQPIWSITYELRRHIWYMLDDEDYFKINRDVHLRCIFNEIWIVFLLPLWT